MPNVQLETQSLDQQSLLELLAARRELTSASAGAKPIDRAIVARIEGELKDDLRRILLAKGKPVDGRFASQRVTELLNQFACKILQDCPPGLLQAQTRQQLLFYVAECLTRILHSHYRAKDRQGEHDATVAVLAKVREDEFAAECPGGIFAALLEQLEAWDQGEPRRRLWAQAVRYYYVVGMRPAQIERQLQATEQMTLQQLGELLGVSKSSAGRLVQEALEELKRALT